MDTESWVQKKRKGITGHLAVIHQIVDFQTEELGTQKLPPVF